MTLSYRTNSQSWVRSAIPAAALACALLVASIRQAQALPTIDDHTMPPSIKHLTATGRTVWANQAELSKINAEYGDAYRIHEGTYTFDSPDRLEYRTQVGPTTVSLITTNDYRLVKVRSGLLNKDVKTDIGADVTKRQTLFALGVLPKNYLDTISAQYQGREMLLGINCEVFLMRWYNQKPTNPMHWIVWIDPDRHYVVQKKLWNDKGAQRETVIYLKPIQVAGDFWMPSRAECYNPEGHLAGVMEYVNISAN
jgi:hypothetical protein